MFWKRLISGVVLLAIAITTMAFGNVALAAVLYLISLIAYRELTKVLGASGEGKSFSALEVVALIGITAYYVVCFLIATQGFDKELLLAVIMAVFLGELLFYVLKFPKYQASQVAAAFFAFLYAPVMLAFTFLTRELEQGIYLVWLILISAWGCDTCAYVVGVLIGKKKIFPVLSPKKSLEGCIGGVVGTMIIAFLYGHFFVEASFPDRRVAPIIAAICGIGAICSMVGDLAASAIKRNHNVKDYGNLIPGHGGIMDRFDSMIVTAPLVYFMAAFLL
ncbi:MAG: phosphatidate cytidylyltransferase [Lachnospiraceae bacterium]|nr:phosphatidate cytidylyltransferase [Lachnospiraceae bacterium]